MALAKLNEFKLMHNTHVVEVVNRSIDSRSSCTVPLRLWYKINVDAAGPSNSMWGFGAIVRDVDDFPMTVATWTILALPDSNVAEVMGLRLGLQFALDMGFQDIVAEGDSLNVVHAMNAIVVDNSYFGMLITECRSISSSFSNFQIAHVRRIANMTAHTLAKFALNSVDCVWIEECPPCISAIVGSDLAS